MLHVSRYMYTVVYSCIVCRPTAECTVDFLHTVGCVCLRPNCLCQNRSHGVTVGLGADALCCCLCLCLCLSRVSDARGEGETVVWLLQAGGAWSVDDCSAWTDTEQFGTMSVRSKSYGKPLRQKYTPPIAILPPHECPSPMKNL